MSDGVARTGGVTLSIIIVSYNCRQYLLDCLVSIGEAKLPFDHEIIVVDNASTDGGIDLIERSFRSVRTIRNGDNVGFARANNQGILESRGEFVLLLNNDTVVLPGTIEAMLSRLRADDTLGAVGCALEGSDWRLQVSFGGMIGFGNEFFQKVFSRAVFAARQKLFGLSVRYPHWVSGAFLLARRQLLLEVGMLDENFFMYTEEVDLCERIRQKGLRICYDPTRRVIHYGGKSTERNRTKAGVEYRKSHLYFYAKHHGARAARLLRAYLLLRTGLDLAFARISGNRELTELRRSIFRVVKDYRLK
ncbi:MAG: glycosyltransferase family 2 protein [Acidobacteriota bacterium]